MTSRKFKPDAEIAQQKRQDALDRLTQGIKQLLDSGDWQKYLQTQAKFHHYSFNNCMLINMQRPDASQVAGFNAWKQLGRQVKKGEKGISILAPLVRSVEAQADDGSTAAIRTLSGFRTVSVFDIDQTEGEPLPQVCQRLQGDDQGLFDLLQAFATNKGIPVIIRAIAANGICRYSQSKPVEIAINADLPPLHKAKTLAHELAHALLHNPKEYGEHRGDMELEAESTAYVVLNHFGFDSASYSLGYVAHWQKAAGEDLEGTLEQLRASAQAIHQASQEVIDWVELQTSSAVTSTISSC